MKVLREALDMTKRSLQHTLDRIPRLLGRAPERDVGNGVLEEDDSLSESGFIASDGLALPSIECDGVDGDAGFDSDEDYDWDQEDVVR